MALSPNEKIQRFSQVVETVPKVQRALEMLYNSLPFNESANIFFLLMGHIHRDFSKTTSLIRVRLGLSHTFCPCFRSAYLCALCTAAPCWQPPCTSYAGHRYLQSDLDALGQLGSMRFSLGNKNNIHNHHPLLPSV